jgi:hypothetical protein
VGDRRSMRKEKTPIEERGRECFIEMEGDLPGT